MKLKTILIASLALLATSSAMAQEGRAKMSDMTREQRVELKAQMVAKKLMIDDATKAKFIPMYISFENDLYNALPAEAKQKMKARREARKDSADKIAAEGSRPAHRMHSQPTCGKMGGLPENFEGKTDAEVKEMIENHFTAQQNRLDVTKKYYKKFSGILTVKQTAAALKSVQGSHHCKKGIHRQMGRNHQPNKGGDAPCRR